MGISSWKAMRSKYPTNDRHEIGYECLPISSDEDERGYQSCEERYVCETPSSSNLAFILIVILCVLFRLLFLAPMLLHTLCSDAIAAVALLGSLVFVVRARESRMGYIPYGFERNVVVRWFLEC
jgi:hypothetical protein